jgi:hypothetical protein
MDDLIRSACALRSRFLDAGSHLLKLTQPDLDEFCSSIAFGHQSMPIARRNRVSVSVFIGLSLALGTASSARAVRDDEKRKETKLERDLKAI